MVFVIIILTVIILTIIIMTTIILTIIILNIIIMLILGFSSLRRSPQETREDPIHKSVAKRRYNFFNGSPIEEDGDGDYLFLYSTVSALVAYDPI